MSEQPSEGEYLSNHPGWLDPSWTISPEEWVRRINEVRTPRFMKLHPDAVIPERHYASDIGWDLTARLDSPLTVLPDSFCDIPCDLAVQLPQGSWGMLIGRSSALRRHGLLINVGVIDEGYTGPLFAGAFNATRSPVTIEDGMRLAQLIVISRHDPAIFKCLEASEMASTERGTAGFGSTG